MIFSVQALFFRILSVIALTFAVGFLVKFGYLPGALFSGLIAGACWHFADGYTIKAIAVGIVQLPPKKDDDDDIYTIGPQAPA